ncbi:MAG: hypothetical protein XXXJIFNMEKO3_01344 [Candidatus Erwinia impunctatus]|nr:hypothetical protein XXXJIFNMEKO_01344 [Culicoides impunctatus]
MLPDCKIGLRYQNTAKYLLHETAALFQQADFIAIAIAPNDQHSSSVSPEYTPGDNRDIVHHQLQCCMQDLKAAGISRPLFLQ